MSALEPFWVNVGNKNAPKVTVVVQKASKNAFVLKRIFLVAFNLVEK
ncbi:hypothetical protein [Mycoplasmoides pneumoniae]|nr:hypothetical protein [Mycoplasmoides pneumoniae]